MGSDKVIYSSKSAAAARKRGFKSLVDRQVVRIITPGSLVDDTMLTPEENNYLAALYYDAKDTWGLAWADLSTGEFVSTTSTSEKLASAISRCSPKEILLPSEHEGTWDSLPEDAQALLDVAIPHDCMKTYRPSASFSLDPASTSSGRGSALTTLHASEKAAAAAIMNYIHFTQKQAVSLVRAPQHVESSDHMIIDTSAWRALEIAKVRSPLLFSVVSAVSHARIDRMGSL